MSDTEKQLFENLAITHMDDLYTKAIRIASCAEAAEYLVQQTYASAFYVFERFDQKTDFNNWLSGILAVVYADSHSCHKQ